MADVKSEELVTVTPKMVLAGWEILFGFEPGLGDRNETVTEIYRAMEKARLKERGVDVGA